MHIFDSHTHFFSRTFYEFQVKQIPGGDGNALLDRLRRAGIDVPGESTSTQRDRIIAELDESGVDRAVTFASIPDEMEIVGEAAASSDGRLVPYAMVDPTTPATMQKLRSLQPRYNFRGMLLFPAMGDYGIGDDVAASALNLAEELGLIVFVHCGQLRIQVRALLGMNPDFPLTRSHPLDLVPVAKARPNLNFVIPHFSAGFFDELLRVGKQCPNVYVDTSGSNEWGMFQAPALELKEMFQATADTFGVGRILYGSDTAGFPRGYRRDILDSQIRAMHAAGIKAENQALVLGGNLARLLGTQRA